jgi:hypothetical protein
MTATIDITGLEGAGVNLTPEQIADLDARIEGQVLRAGDDGWDGAVLLWNGMVAKVPALVVQPVSAADVVVAVGFARDHGLLLGIKGGGHNIAGTGIAERGLTLDMSRMRDVAVDPDARLAHVGPDACCPTSIGRRRRTGWRPCSASSRRSGSRASRSVAASDT